MQIQKSDINKLIEGLTTGSAKAAADSFLKTYERYNLTSVDLVALLKQIGAKEAMLQVGFLMHAEQPENWEILNFLFSLASDHKFYDEILAGDGAKALSLRRALNQCYDKQIALKPHAWASYYGVLRYLARSHQADEIQRVIDNAQCHLNDQTLDWQSGASFEHIAHPTELERKKEWVEVNVAKKREAARQSLEAASIGQWRSETSETVVKPSAEFLNSHGTPTPPGAITNEACELGTDGLSVWGHVSALARGAQYRFEYGDAPDALDRHTKWRPVPGALNAQLSVDPSYDFRRYRFYTAKLTWDADRGLPTLHSPFGKDPNHLSGAGFLDLIGGLRMAKNTSDEAVMAEAEYLDIRDARLTAYMSARTYDGKDFQLVFCHVTFDTVPNENGDTIDTSWGFSAEPLDCEEIADGELHPITITYTADPRLWTPLGNNPDEQPRASLRHLYRPLGWSLAHHRTTCPIAGLFGDWRDTPEGILQIGRANLVFRSQSVLQDLTASKLVRYPEETQQDPIRITGDRPDQPTGGWLFIGNPIKPPTFEWEFDTPQPLTAMAVRNHRVFPCKKVRISLIDIDGRSLSQDVDLGSDNGIGADSEARGNMNHDHPIKRVRLELLQAVDPNGIGLEAFEIFAKDFHPSPDGVPASVCEDITGLSSGQLIYYRLVCRDDEQIATGETRKIKLPEDNRPIAYDLTPRRISPEKSTFLFRGNAMGERTTIKWRLNDGDWREHSFGWEKTSKHHLITLRALSAETERTLTAVLENSSGESARLHVTFSPCGGG